MVFELDKENICKSIDNGISLLPFCLPSVRDSGNDFWVPKIGSDNSGFSLILFSYPHVVPSHFSKTPN